MRCSNNDATSAFGTNRNSACRPTMSAPEGRADMPCYEAHFRSERSRRAPWAKIVPSYCFRNIFSKNAENAAKNDCTGVELGRCKTLNGFAQLRELSFTIYVTASRSADEFVHCSRADLTLDFLFAVQHRKSERHSLFVVTPNMAPRKRH